MLDRFRVAGLIWPTVFAVAGLAALIGLGTWQMQRKAWKDGLQRQIVERTRVQPLPLGGDVLIVDAKGLGTEYLRVRLSGRFLHTQERHLHMPSKAGPGWHVITPVVLGGGMIVLVNRGWVPDALKNPNQRREGQIEGPAEMIGLVRAPERPGWLLPANDPARNVWFWRDLEGMLACRNAAPNSADCRALEGQELPAGLRRPTHYPFFLDAEAGPANPGGWPKGGTTIVNLPNPHLGYALTWYGLAATLIGVYVAFARDRLRAAEPARPVA